ncbi:MAG: extracellular solute-binding protein [Anaerolineae bacterium]|nr:extracellular solute-binding protein [Anaerolineae bacterium]
MSDLTLNRRTFLRTVALTSASVLAGACQPKVVEVEKVVEKEVTKIVEKVVEKPAPKGVPVVKLLVMSWITGEVPVDNLLRQYNAEHPEVKIEVEALTDGWEQKHLAAVRAGNPIWNTASEFNPWREGLAAIKMGLVQPMDDYIQSSSIPGAAKIADDWLDLVKAQMVIEGKTYALPMDMDVTAFGLQLEYCNAVGIESVPKTWEDITLAARKIRDQFKGEDVFGIATGNWWVYDGPGGIFYNITKEPFSDEGILNVTSEDFQYALQLCKQWQDEDLSPMPFYQDTTDLWKKNKIGMTFEPGAWIIWGQSIWGKTAIADPMPMPLYPGGGTAACEVMAMGLLQGAPYPKEAMDALLWLWGPQNEAMQTAICETAKTPCYKSVYDTAVAPNPDWAWMLEIRKMYDQCIPLPHVASYSIQNDMLTKWTQSYFLGQEPDPKIAMDKCLADIKAELAKQA